MSKTNFCGNELELEFQDVCECCGTDITQLDFFDEDTDFGAGFLVKVIRKNIQTGKVIKSFECCDCVHLSDKEYWARKQDSQQNQGNSSESVNEPAEIAV